jgi:hypothetical protein
MAATFLFLFGLFDGGIDDIPSFIISVNASSQNPIFKKKKAINAELFHFLKRTM